MKEAKDLPHRLRPSNNFRFHAERGFEKRCHIFPINLRPLFSDKLLHFSLIIIDLFSRKFIEQSKIRAKT